MRSASGELPQGTRGILILEARCCWHGRTGTVWRS